MVLTLLGPVILDAVQRNVHSKGFMTIIHQTDEGYAVGQHGGQQLDKLEIDATLWGPERYVVKELLNTISDSGKPWPFISRLASFFRVKVDNFRFSEGLDTINVNMTIQRVKIARWEKLVQVAGGILTLVGSGLQQVAWGGDAFSKTFADKGTNFLTSLTETVTLGIYPPRGGAGL